MKTKIILFISLFLCIQHVYSETIRGKVVDENDSPVIGATILVQNTKTGTITDFDGNFEINTSAGELLEVKYLGFETQILTVKDKSYIHIVLKESNTRLDEIVVVGYGSIEKKKLTSAISSIKSEDFNLGSIKDAGQLIMGKVAGLNISNPSGNPVDGVEITLRGTNSLSGTNSPLVLIDGVPGDLKLVSPDNIASMDVLKDGSAAAIYGTRANNGVILITTKQAEKNKTSVIYNGYISTEQIFRTPEVMTASKFREILNSGNDYIMENSDYGASTDWLDQITRTPFTQNHSVTLSNGKEDTKIFANLTYKKSQGVFLNSDQDEIIGRLSVDQSIFDGLFKVNINAIVNQRDFTVTADGDQSFNSYAYNMALTANPTAPISLDGQWTQPKFLGIDMATWENPVAILKEQKGNNDNFTGRLYGNLSFHPTQDFKMNLLLSFERYNQTRGFSKSSKDISNTVYSSAPLFASRAATQTENSMLEITGQYDKAFEKHHFTLLGGYSYSDNVLEHFWMNNYGFPSDQLTYHNMGLGTALKEGKAGMYSTKTSGNLIGFFGRINYSFDERYMLTASARYEGDSKFVGSDDEWGVFPAISAAWRINKESFMKGFSFLDDLKLRAGYGVTGISPNAYYQTIYRLQYSGTGNSFYYDGEWVTPLGPANNVNTKFTWEKKHEYNVGLDFSFLKGYLSGSVDVYNRETTDLLWDFNVPVPPNEFPTTKANIGDITNSGIEVLLSSNIGKRSSFLWVPTVTFSYNTNKLESLNFEKFGAENTRDYFFTGDAGQPSYAKTHRVKVGEPIGQIWGYKVVDIDDDGKWIYDDPNNPGQTFTSGSEGVTQETHGQVLGNSIPKYYLAFQNSFSYKNFDLGILMRGAFDYSIINQYRLRNENVSQERGNNKLLTSFDPIFGKSVNRSSVEMNSYYVEKGDFWKVDNITLGYTFAPKLKYLQSIRIYGAVNNVLILTSYEGSDPESVSRSGLAPGMDHSNKYPTTRTYTLGLNLNF